MLLFPFLYLTLELPKRIINDAIGAAQNVVVVFGVPLSQTTFLWLLCGLFLLSVLGHGLLKVRINTMKGALSERMLRRFRYLLVTRLFRFPKPYFQRTSQAEIVSMITSESEPMGGMMGDAISQPVLQAGQMATILMFLFLQSFWFGLAAIALIPLQAWLIPMLQRRINVLNKARIGEVRKLAAEIGETAAGTPTLRTSGAHSYRSAMVTHRLGRLFFIRLDIYRKKFFMKFLNNFITQLTPFFFFSVGGYLVIRGNVSLGALVAALAAYKDLSAPWKELLTYYTSFHEMSQRWTLITDRFAPAGMMEDGLFDDPPETIGRLTGDIVFDRVSARDVDGIPLVENLSFTIPGGGVATISCVTPEERQVISELLTREIVPSEGRITIGGRDLASLHQAEIGTRIGWADSAPYLFAGTIDDNMMLALKSMGRVGDTELPELAMERLEATRSGNSTVLLEDNWIDPARLGMQSLSDVRAWWLDIIEGMGADRELVRRALGLRIAAQEAPEVAQHLVDLRDEVRVRLDGDGLLSTMRPFEHETYNKAVPLLENLLFAAPSEPVTQRELAEHNGFLPLLRAVDLVAEIAEVAQAVTDLLHDTFGADGTDHPLFRRLGIDQTDFDATLRISNRAKSDGLSGVSDEDLALLLALPCLLAPDQVGSFVPLALQDQVVAARQAVPQDPAKRLSELYQQLDPTSFSDGLSVVENMLFGVVNKDVGKRVDLLFETIAAILDEQGLKSEIATLSLSEESLLGGTNLSPRVRERVAFTRAAIKRPDVLVLDKALASYEAETRAAAVSRLHQALPDATIVLLDSSFDETQQSDVSIEIAQGRLAHEGRDSPDQGKETTSGSATDLATKLQALRQSVFFSELDQKQLRLLAFSAKWFNIPHGEVIFSQGEDSASGVYLIQKGEADFIAPGKDGKEDVLIRIAGPGSLVGELGLILGVPRTLTMTSRTDLSGLVIGGEEFLSVMQHDAGTTFKLMQLIAGYLSKSAAEQTQK
ncbi:ABC transporter transmembrane domain-containing protein [Sulfitobacter aestuariivivens]|nr:ABC transporter transmembrane domain-containing protein [Sulfitobacter aestuariivivens]